MNAGTRRSVGAGLIFVMLLATSAFAGQAVSALAGATPPQVRDGSAALVGHYEPQQHLRLVIGLQHPNLAAEEQFLEELHTRGSPNFMQFLTPAEWTKRFAPAAADEQAVVDWAISQGMTVTQRYANRLLVDVDAPSGIIEKAFGVTINKYQVGTRTAFSNDRDAAIPTSLQGIIHSVGGLNSIQVLNPASKFASEPTFADYVAGPAKAVGGAGGADSTVKRSAPGAASAPKPDITGGAYDPEDIYSSQAYDVNALYALGHCCNPLASPNVTPPQSSIAIATAGTQDGNDFAGFVASYPPLAYHYQQYYIDGTPSGGDTEGTMDFEWSTAWANSLGSEANTAMIYMYNGADSHFSTFTDVYNQILSDGKARVFSTSWGCAEISCTPSSTMDTDHGIFNAMIAQGWTLIAASGDQGATAGCGDAEAVQYPASDPNVVAAGGTNLALYSNGFYDHEYGWTGNPDGCASNGGGSTGGLSVYWGAPSYQTPLGGSGARTVPDIALNADWYNSPQNYFFNGALHHNGGTSIVAPSVAGFFAQANAYLDYVATINGGCNGKTTCTPLGNGNWYLYWFGENSKYAPHYPFYDITSGCNDNDVTAKYGLGYFCAASGYDEVTGWGSFNALQLAWAINTYSAGDNRRPAISFAGPALNTWFRTDQAVSWTATDTGYAQPTGIAGASQSWDSSLSDSASEPTPGAGDGFYSGPQLPNATSGQLLLSLAGQGCHTASVRAYDNIGLSTYESYGPICYDSIPPVSFYQLSGTLITNGVYASAVGIAMGATDYGSGVALTYYNLDSAGYVISPGFITVSALGVHKILIRSTDRAGNTEVAQTVNFKIKSPTTTSLASSPNPSIYGQAVTLTATVATTGGDTPTGSVTFTDGATVLGKALLSAGVATFVTRALHAGDHSISASYAGDAANGPSTSVAGAQTVVVATSKTKVTSSLNPSQYGQSVTLSAKVTSGFGGSVSGTVTFTDGTTALGTEAVNTTTNTATLVTAALKGGAYTITAAYNGSGDDSASTGTLKQTVSKAATRTTVVSSLNPSTFGTSVTFTATVIGANGGAITGAVEFLDGKVKLGTVLLVSGNTHPKFSTASLATGNHAITAVYGGNVNSTPSTSAVLEQVVSGL